MNQNYFALFQLPPQFDLDVEDLARRHRAVITRVHPDQFAHKSAVEQRMAVQWASLANQAFDTLRQPLARAQYLLILNAPELADEKASVALPPEFLMQQMEWREAIEHGNSEHIRAEALQRHEANLAQIHVACDSADWAQVQNLLAQGQFLENFLKQIA